MPCLGSLRTADYASGPRPRLWGAASVAWAARLPRRPPPARRRRGAARLRQRLISRPAGDPRDQRRADALVLPGVDDLDAQFGRLRIVLQAHGAYDRDRRALRRERDERQMIARVHVRQVTAVGRGQARLGAVVALVA